jgi:hypothetical protein
LGFAAALFCLNLIKDREVHLVIQNFKYASLTFMPPLRGLTH